MKVLRLKNIDNCRQVINMVDIFLDTELSENFIMYLGELGNLEYHPEFPKPYFKLFITNEHVIMGSKGNSSMRIVLYNQDSKEALKFIEYNVVTHIENFEGDEE